LIDDSQPEAPKDFTVTLTSCRIGLDTPVSVTGGIVTTRVVILDDDVAPYTVSLAEAAKSAEEVRSAAGLAGHYRGVVAAIDAVAESGGLAYVALVTLEIGGERLWGGGEGIRYPVRKNPVI